jgi:hypothetical protein
MWDPAHSEIERQHPHMKPYSSYKGVQSFEIISDIQIWGHIGVMKGLHTNIYIYIYIYIYIFIIYIYIYTCKHFTSSICIYNVNCQRLAVNSRGPLSPPATPVWIDTTQLSIASCAPGIQSNVPGIKSWIKQLKVEPCTHMHPQFLASKLNHVLYRVCMYVCSRNKEKNENDRERR